MKWREVFLEEVLNKYLMFINSLESLFGFVKPSRSEFGRLMCEECHDVCVISSRITSKVKYATIIKAIGYCLNLRIGLTILRSY